MTCWQRLPQRKPTSEPVQRLRDFHRVAKRITQRLLELATGVSLAVIVGVVLSNSISRYAFNNTFIWAEGAAVYAMIYGTVFGVLLAYVQHLNVRFGVVSGLLRRVAGLRAEAALALVVHGVHIILGGVFTVSALAFVRARGGILASGINVPVGYFQGAMVVFGIGLVVVAGLGLLEQLIVLANHPKRVS